MNILIVNKFLYPNGGSETYIFKLGEQLIKMGHDVQFFGMEHEGRCVGNRAKIYTSDMDFHGRIKLAKLIYPLKAIYSKEARKKMKLVLEDFKPDVVHLNNFNYQLTPSIILAVKDYEKSLGKKVHIIYTAHDYQLVCPNHMMNNPNTGENCEKCARGAFLNCTKGKCIHGSIAKSVIGTMEATFWNKKGTYKYIDKIICCSHFMKTKLDLNPVFKDKTIVLHNFVEAPDKKIVAKKDYVLYFGRFSKEKGIQTLINAAKDLSEVRFVFAGTGPLEDRIKGIENIEYVGFKTGTELELLIREALLSVYPSEWYENCPFSVMESRVHGTPVLGANIGGIPELVDEGKTGELFSSGDKDELEKKLLSLWNNKEKLSVYSKNCKEKVFDTVEDYCRKLEEIYHG